MTNINGDIISLTPKTFYKLKQIFTNINEIKIFTPINLIVKIISTEILIRKTINPGTLSGPGEELILLKVCLADDTGTMNAFLKNENIKFAKIGESIIIRECRVEIINGNIIIICDENCHIFQYKGLLDNNSIQANVLDINYSNINLNSCDYSELI